MKISGKKLFLPFFTITLGGTIFSLAVSLFLDPNNIVPGGITGVAMLLHELFPVLPIGLTALAINIPLLLLAWRLLGSRFLMLTVYGTVISSVMIDVSAKLLPPVDIDPMLAAVAGGCLSGLGLGMVFTQGATTGGSDIIARLFKLVFSHMQMGKLMLGIDGIIVILSVFVYRDIAVGLYAAITLFISARAIDAILYGMNVERVAYIISEQNEVIAVEIGRRLERGATFLHGEGGYTGLPRKVILCAIKRQQITLLKKLVKEIDPSAFVILTEAHEVLGEGFHGYNEGG